MLDGYKEEKGGGGEAGGARRSNRSLWYFCKHPKIEYNKVNKVVNQNLNSYKNKCSYVIFDNTSNKNI